MKTRDKHHSFSVDPPCIWQMGYGSTRPIGPFADGISPALTTSDWQNNNVLVESVAQGKPIRIKMAVKQGYVEVPVGAVFDASFPYSKDRRGRLQDGGNVCPALTTAGIHGLWYYEGAE